jgi:UDP-N-acetylglucosamine--N-acetylmuramyl-(pentapeptide) pyrophosphoryl-undecaprenol N-acetylglucosamine transferase
MMQAFSIIKEFQPDVVIGTGGYVSGPMLFAATLKSIPTLIQEQNSFPGETTRFLSKRVNEVHIAFEESKKYLPHAKHVYVSGNPTRKELGKPGREGSLQYFGFRSEERVQTLLIFGGSLGAGSLNGGVLNHLDELLANDIRIIWQTGKTTDPRIIALRDKYSTDRLWINAFIDRMDYAYAASDLIICRAGATTIAELTLLGKPAILVPFPHAAADHQTKNAKTLEQAGAAVVVADHEFNERLMSVVRQVSNNNVLERMGAESKKLAKPDAANIIAKRILQLKNQKG